MNIYSPRLAPTGIGSLPHRCTDEALQLIGRHLEEVPFWPQLPRRCPAEHMVRQFGRPLPGLKEVEGGLQMQLPGVENAAQLLLQRYVDGEVMRNPCPGRAAGLYAFVQKGWPAARAVKGQITGPITFALSVRDGTEDRPILYSDEAMQYAVAVLAMSASWQEQFLRDAFGKPTIMFVDEPALGSLGSAFYPYPPQKTKKWLAEILEALSGLTAVHCCGTADWEMLMNVGFDIISFDAHEYGEQFAANAEAVRLFCQSGGMLAWGLVPTDPEVNDADVGAMADRWEDLAGRIACGAEAREIGRVASQSLLTPACGLGGRTVAEAERTLALTAELSRRLRKRVWGRASCG